MALSITSRPRASIVQTMNEDQENKPGESFAEFCKRLGIKHNTKQGGVEISPYSGGNLCPRGRKKAKVTSNEPQESFAEFCKRPRIKLHKDEKGGQEFGAYPGGNLLSKRPKWS